MNEILTKWNQASVEDATDAMIACCGARRWAREMTALRPFVDGAALSEAADAVWRRMEVQDWMEAFACHPRIGERKAAHATEQSRTWSRQEQRQVATAPELTLATLAEGNARYEDLFGFTYIVCATGKSAGEMLTILQRRLKSTREEELREAAEQQRQILQIRLGKWLTR